MYNGCKDNIKKGSIVLFEGGSTVRDNVPWMIDLKKTKINDVKDKVNYKVKKPITNTKDFKFSRNLLNEMSSQYGNICYLNLK